MTRLRADVLLLLVTVIWGTAFVAQKDALAHMGPLTFVAARFALSALVILPFVFFERRKAPLSLDAAGRGALFVLGLSFTVAVALQQTGMALGSTIVNAGFLTGLYALFVPLICRMVLGQALPFRIYPAAFACVAGMWFLSGAADGGLTTFGWGDALMMLCGFSFAVQIVMLGRLLMRAGSPFQLCCGQYVVAAVLCGIAAFIFEAPSLTGMESALWPLLYAGVISGGIAYTMQGVAQRYTPASDAGVIMSAEAVVAAIAGVWMRGEHMTLLMATGGALILGAILLIELGAFFRKPKKNVIPGAAEESSPVPRKPVSQ